MALISRKMVTVGIPIVIGLASLGLAIALSFFYVYGKNLPDYRQLKQYSPDVASRVYADTGCVMAEYAIEKRLFIPISAIPKRLQNAFIAAEDDRFWHHSGIDFTAMARAAVANVIGVIRGRRPQGGSTITQQVAKNFLLSNVVSLERKIKEAILALRIEKALDKNHILELYLNEIYLGYGSYGVGAAALNYFDKSLDDLTLPEIAFLAALPKAPNNYHPIRHRERAIARRNWVLARMEEEGYISPEQLQRDSATPLASRENRSNICPQADYFNAYVRQELIDRYGLSTLYSDGLAVRTSMDVPMQLAADRSLRQGLISYDQRHAFRGPIAHINLQDSKSWHHHSLPSGLPSELHNWRYAIILDIGTKTARIGIMGDGTEGTLTSIAWKRFTNADGTTRPITSLAAILKPGDLIFVEAVGDDYTLRQIPEISGGIIALDPHTGRVLAMSGGYDWTISEFNRAVQAQRQPGSAFKPFVYLTALQQGYAPNSIILDAPFVVDQGNDLGRWKPANYTKTFYGPTPMRVGLEKSRNLMTVRLAQAVGITAIRDQAKAFNIAPDWPPHLSIALGAGETNLLALTSAYASLVNSGKAITPSVIDRVQDRHGRTIDRRDTRQCPSCQDTWDSEQAPPYPTDTRQTLIDPISAYQIVSMLEGVVQRGTGKKLRSLNRPIAGKTGTTNDNRDAWFIGFTPDLVVGVFIGFDTPKSMGKHENGSSVAAPVVKAFFEEVLVNKPAIPFRIPPGIRMVRLDPQTGKPVAAGSKNAILEALRIDQSQSKSLTPLTSNDINRQNNKSVDPMDALY